jgi:hypothetical protein
MFAVIRVEKRKGAAISAIEKHNSRTIEILPDGKEKRWAENADHNLSKFNVAFKKFPNLNLAQSINKHLENVGILKTRKDAVKAIEILCTASPEFFNSTEHDFRVKEYKKLADQFIAEKYGADNVMTTDLHLDEKTPHIHYVVVPITKDKRLSAKELCGNRKAYQSLQSDFSLKMKPLGLKRGIEGSNAKHIEMKEFYGALKNDITPINQFLEKRKSSEVSKLSRELKKTKVIAQFAYELLKKNNFTLDKLTLQPRKLTAEEIDALKYNNDKNKKI